MAKKSVVNMSLLSAINAGTVTHVPYADGVPLVNHNPPLIEVDTTSLDANGSAAVRLTDAGKQALPNGSAAKSEYANSSTPKYAVIDGLTFAPGEKKRGGRGGGAGAPTIYPWATMEVGGTFFVGVSDKPDPVKSMTSAVSSANMKYSEEVGDEKQKLVVKRGPGNKAVLDASGNPVKEMVMRRDRKAVKKFELRAVKKGDAFGEWVAKEDGVIVGRTV